MTVIGIIWGAAAALAVSRLLSAQLFGVGARDPRVCVVSGVRARIETMPLDRVAEAYERMMSAQAHFRMVVTTGA